ncbi:MAG: hypothetical protein AAB797_00505 [Patescibacteria group bacterium]
MSGFPINSSVSLQVKPGSFGAYVDENGLQLPVKMYILAQGIGWQNAELFFLGSLDFPEIVQEEFGWSAEQCQQASNELRELLRNFLPDIVLNPPEIEDHPMGARPPDTD